MTSPTDPQRWTFLVPTPLGDSRASYSLDATSLRYESDDVFSDGVQTLRWDTIREAGTSAMAGMGGRGAPDLPRWVPQQLEWLVLARTPGSGDDFMGPLPPGSDREALLAALREHLGPRWSLGPMPLGEVRGRVASRQWSTPKVVGIVVAVLALLVALLFVLVLLMQPVIVVPAGLLVGGWLCHSAWTGLRNVKLVAATDKARIGRARLGLVALEGRAVSEQASAAAVSGRPSAFWDVSVQLFYDDRDGGGVWRQVASRHGGTIGCIEFEDATGRLPIWLAEADLVLDSQDWESTDDELPAPGVALLDELGFPWGDGRRIRVVETRIGVGEPLYVLGTLAERRQLPAPAPPTLVQRWRRLLRTGEWRRALVAAAPRPAREIVAVLIGFLGLVTLVGHGGDRTPQADRGPAPVLDPLARLLWKGSADSPFIVSNRPAEGALATLRRRSLIRAAIGVVVILFVLSELG